MLLYMIYACITLLICDLGQKYAYIYSSILTSDFRKYLRYIPDISPFPIKFPGRYSRYGRYLKHWVWKATNLILTLNYKPFSFRQFSNLMSNLSDWLKPQTNSSSLTDELPLCPNYTQDLIGVLAYIILWDNLWRKHLETNLIFTLLTLSLPKFTREITTMLDVELGVQTEKQFRWVISHFL